MTTQFNYPEYAIIDGEKFKINTDFRVAIRCNDISMDNSIDITEKVLAIIYLLFGKKGLEARDKYEQLGEKAVYYLQCGKNIDEKTKKEEDPDMDFIQDMPFIEASFMSDYHIDLANIEMHWWKFYNLICGLSNNDMGNCCVLNRIRNIRTMDISKIKDPKEKNKLKEAKELFALKKKEKQKQFTAEEIKNMEEYHRLIGK